MAVVNGVPLTTAAFTNSGSLVSTADIVSAKRG